MNRRSDPMPAAAHDADLTRLQGRTVLVRTTRDQRNPPAAMRGTIVMHKEPGAAPTVSIALDFPQMFATRAHHRTIVLDDAGLATLLASENNGAFEFTIDDDLW